MRLKGKTISPPPSKRVPLPRASGEDIVLTVQPVMDYSDFDRLCPVPKPPLKMVPGKPPVPLTADAGYLKKVNQHATRKFSWLCIKSLEATPGLEWARVDITKPETWEHFTAEMSTCFSPHEIDLIIDGIMDVNHPSEEARKDALQRFMSRQEEEAVSTSQTDGLNSTQSFESVKDLV